VIKINNKVMKVCRICKKEKSLASFQKRKKSKDGYSNECKCCSSEYQSNYRENNKKKIKEKNKQWRENNKEKSDAIYAKYRKTEKRRKVSREWARKNRKHITDSWRERYNNDIEFNLQIKLRRRIHSSLKNRKITKSNTNIKLLGCSYADLKKYIESKFTPGMTWDKVLKSEIHLDHIIPVDNFNLFDVEEQKRCFHYTNLQPLWGEENQQKKAKIVFIS
jgi:hypothetical protein